MGTVAGAARSRFASTAEGQSRCTADVVAADGLIRAYHHATRTVVAAGFAYELEWQRQLSFERITEEAFLRESAWVILSAGMREAVIRAKFAAISRAFLNWRSASAICARHHSCRARALQEFHHAKKIGSIIAVAEHTAAIGFNAVKDAIATEGVDYLGRLPFVGPTTRWHLAKNLGLDVAKPDRHLMRIAVAAGFPSPHHLCTAIAASTGDRVALVDLVLWRYATLQTNYCVLFA
jgi:hypothetical protein